MRSKKNVPIITILSFLFIGCPSHINFDEYQGKIINEYPDWCCLYVNASSKEKVKAESGGYPAFGYSEWKDWQESEGKLLHSFVEDNVIADNYSGKFRIAVFGQLIKICFNDANSSYTDFFAYLGDFNNYYKDRLVYIDLDSDVVKYDCWLRKGNGYSKFSDICNESNSSKVSMRKIDDNTYNFLLMVQGEKIIDTMLKNISVSLKPAEVTKIYSWFPAAFTEVIGDNYYKNGYYGKGRILFLVNDNHISLALAQMVPLYCFEGISFRSVDEENKKISFNLLDAGKSDFADYFEIHILDEYWTDCPERGATENSSLMKGTLGFYKEGNTMPIKFYDENHSQFIRR